MAVLYAGMNARFNEFGCKVCRHYLLLVLCTPVGCSGSRLEGGSRVCNLTLYVSMWRAASICVKTGPVNRAPSMIKRATMLPMMMVGKKKNRKWVKPLQQQEGGRTYQTVGTTDVRPLGT